jgi:hypothetical protein
LFTSGVSHSVVQPEVAQPVVEVPSCNTKTSRYYIGLSLSTWTYIGVGLVVLIVAGVVVYYVYMGEAPDIGGMAGATIGVVTEGLVLPREEELYSIGLGEENGVSRLIQLASEIVKSGQITPTFDVRCSELVTQLHLEGLGQHADIALPDLMNRIINEGAPCSYATVKSVVAEVKRLFPN